jgi:phospholipase/carboxylesterase
MNRLPTFSSAKLALEQMLSEDDFETQGNRESSLRQDGLIYRTLSPAHYVPKHAYPLIIWLHSEADNERQLINIMRHVSDQNYVAIAPRGPLTEACGYTYTWSQAETAVYAARQYVHDCVRIAREKFNVNREHMFLAGLHSGGTMALRIALAEPELFAGAVSIGGKFPLGCQSLLRYKAAQDLPLLMMRGLEAEHYTEADVCEELRLVHAAHLQAHFRHYNCGDELRVPMLQDLNRWCMERVTGMQLLDIEETNSFSSGS